MKLSRKRAESVCKYVIKRGVHKDRLSTKAFGESVNIGDSYEQNRRVEFIIID